MCSPFSPNVSFKAAIGRKFESVPTAFYVNRILNWGRIRPSGKKKSKKKKQHHVFSLSISTISNSHMAPKLTHPHELSLMSASHF